MVHAGRREMRNGAKASGRPQHREHEGRRVLVRNASANALQNLVSGVVLFLVFRHISTNLGAEAIGVWSLLTAAASVSRVADLGLTQAVVPFVARYRQGPNPEAGARLLETAVLTLGLTLAVVALLAYPVVTRLASHLLPMLGPVQAGTFTGLTLLSFWLAAVAALIQGGFDGSEQMHIRAVVVVAGHVVLLASVIALVPSRGLAGVFVAQVLQGTFLACASWLGVRCYVPGLRWLRLRWSSVHFRELMSYGGGVQVSAILSLLLDPLTKVLLANFGGARLVGYFEVASQVVLRIRSLLVSANQAVVPAVAGLASRGSEEVRRIYIENVRALAVASSLVFGCLIMGAGYVGLFTLGRHEHLFATVLRVVTAAWYLNTLNVPAYFVNLGLGRLKWNILSHATIAGLNAGLGWAAGTVWGASGVLGVYVLALVCGSALVIFGLHREQSMPMRLLWRGL
jgi:O-antigen/teichoic acid export membrane protein